MSPSSNIGTNGIEFSTPYWKDELKKTFKLLDQMIEKKEFDDMDYYYFYLSIFSSHFFDKLLSIYSKQLAGGDWYDLGKTHTGYIPVPSIFSARVKDSPAYGQLVTIGKEISNGNYYLRDVTDDVLLKFIYPTSINF